MTRTATEQRLIQDLFDVGPAGAPTDGELLARFLDERSEPAGAILVGRLGPVALGAARSVLRNPHEAEDVVQATLLILIRRSRSLLDRPILAGWVHRTAYRLALRADRQARARRRRDSASGPGRVPTEVDPAEAGADADLRRVVAAELDRLPTRYRAPVLLCHFEGLSHEAAAHRLGCPVGTVGGRLTRARRLLRDRLARRGVGVPGLALTLPDAGQPGPIPADLVRSLVARVLAEAARPAARRLLAGAGPGTGWRVALLIGVGLVGGWAAYAWAGHRGDPGRIYVTATRVLETKKTMILVDTPIRSSARLLVEGHEPGTWDERLPAMDFAGGRLVVGIAAGGSKFATAAGVGEPNNDGDRVVVRVLDGRGGSRPVFEFRRPHSSFADLEEVLLRWSATGDRLLVAWNRHGNNERLPVAFEAWAVLDNGSPPRSIAIPPDRHIVDWSPDGEWLLSVDVPSQKFRSAPEFNLFPRAIRLMRLDGTAERVVVTTPQMGCIPAFSPDGRSIAYQVLDEYREAPIPGRMLTSLHVIGADGTGDRLIRRQVDGNHWRVRWSPDGRHIVFKVTTGPTAWSSDQPGPEPQDWIGVIDADGGNFRLVTPASNPQKDEIQTRLIDWQ